MSEQLDLTTAKPSTGGTTFWEVDNLRLYWGAAELVIGLIGENGENLTVGYEGAEATTLMRALNKIDLSVKSLQRRILEKLDADGKIAGSVSGTPD